MALTYADYAIWTELKRMGLTPTDPAILEIGQANWYGDVDPRVFEPDLTEKRDAFELASLFYMSIFGENIAPVAIDLHGQDCLKFDLNDSQLWASDKFDVVINTGTTEHVFNQYQVFKTIHDACKVGGLMLHGVPWRGWTNHSFYCYQPTFFLDLAAANGYKILSLCMFVLGTTYLKPFHSIAEVNEIDRARALPDEAMIYCVFQRENANSFKSPMQGIYNESLSEKDRADWLALRSR